MTITFVFNQQVSNDEKKSFSGMISSFGKYRKPSIAEFVVQMQGVEPSDIIAPPMKPDAEIKSTSSIKSPSSNFPTLFHTARLIILPEAKTRSG